ncbi:nuclear transport factor 2 family protein [Sneathiella chinensis]|uniref:SnoaL-like domain-containing protein n=1 Tax=Sneathiella chinensis TaxID=349750 RepID=A0ABQ5U410_9PROT|nr:nuclear transport factor 2 family protein [Sneathiella chinensis]GLQ05935.1 hypothetical protein GCM10007924_11560 [Sneathiella chinensis]
MTSPDMIEKACAAYARYFETLSPETVDDLDGLAGDALYFEDPFNQVRGRDKVKQLFRQMFDHVSDPAFHVYPPYWESGKGQVLLKWRFTGQNRHLGPIDFVGLSEVTFDAEGKIVSHVDYWDASTHFYAKIPLIGGMIRFVKRRMAL